MKEALRFRQATVEDVETIVRHRRLMFEEMGYSGAGQLDEMDSHVRAQLLTMIPAGDYCGWIVEDESGAVIAGAGAIVVRLLGKPFNTTGAYSYLLSLYVNPEHRRRGIARRLMKQAIDWSRSEGFAEAKLHASNFGRSLYEELGFKQTNEMRMQIDREG